MGYISYDEALQVKGRKFEDLDVPELGGTLRLGSMLSETMLEIKQLESKKAKGEDVERRQTELLLMGALVKPDGSPFLDNKTVGAFVKKIPFNALQTIIKKVTEMMKADGEQSQEENSPGNSEASPSDS